MSLFATKEPHKNKPSLATICRNFKALRPFLVSSDSWGKSPQLRKVGFIFGELPERIHP